MFPDKSPGAAIRLPDPSLRHRAATRLAVVLLAALAVPSGAARAAPMARFEQFSLDGRDIFRPAVGLEVASADSEAWRCGGSYALHRQVGGDPNPELFHVVEASGAFRRGRDQVLGHFRSESDEPVAGGWKTFLAVGGATRDVFRGGRARLSLGAGLAVGGLGLELPDGTDIVVLPVPLVQWRWVTDFVDIALSSLWGADFAIAGGRRGPLRLDGALGFRRLREWRDVDFDVALSYRFFAPDEGDLAGVMAGVRNRSWHVEPARGPSQDLTCLAPYAGFDLSIVRITGGIALAGSERRGNAARRDLGDGTFLAVQARLPLGAGP